VESCRSLSIDLSPLLFRPFSGTATRIGMSVTASLLQYSSAAGEMMPTAITFANGHTDAFIHAYNAYATILRHRKAEEYRNKFELTGA
jgi:hypothetical protein